MPIPFLAPALTALTVALSGKEVYDLFGESEVSKQRKALKKQRAVGQLLADNESARLGLLEDQVRGEGELITRLENLGSRANSAASAVQEVEAIRFQEMLQREQQTLANTATRIPPSMPEVAALLGIRM